MVVSIDQGLHMEMAGKFITLLNDKVQELTKISLGLFFETQSGWLIHKGPAGRSYLYHSGIHASTS